MWTGDIGEPDFFSQNHDWMLPTVDQTDLSRLGYSNIGYQAPAFMETKQTESMSATASVVSQPQSDVCSASGSGFGTGKRKCQDMLSTDGMDDEDEDPEYMKKFARQNHSEIEKRRRDKMNTYILQLSKMLPMCNVMNRKCDKLTVLRMAVQHMKSLKGSSTSFTEALHKPSFLKDDELKHTILEAADGFLFVVGCDRARILFVSESVTNVLQYTRNELIGQSLFDFLHPRDITKVKEQFSSSDLVPRERLIDAKTLMPVKNELPQCPTHLCSGARRSFYCRMKYRSEMCESAKGMKFEKDNGEFVHRKRKPDQNSYTVIHFTGYLKSWPTSKINISSEDDMEDNSNFLSCLVAIGQIRTSFNHSVSSLSSSTTITAPGISLSSSGQNLRPLEYMFRISLEGKLTFIDQATTIVLGYLPQELIGTSVYEYYHQDDLTRMAEIHRKVLDSKEKIVTGVYRFKAKSGSFLPVRSTCFSFRNPWTREVEYIVSTNSFVPMEEVTSSGQGYESVLSLDSDCSTADCSMAEKIGGGCQEKVFIPGLPGGTKPGAGRIGRQIADEMLESSRRSRSPQVVDSTNTETFDNQLPGRQLGGCDPQISGGHNLNLNVTRGMGTSHMTKGPNGIHVSSEHICETNSLLDSVIEEQVVESVSDVVGTDDGDEAAMSLIMSLLEADAGLGGPIDFNDLPWPL